MTYSADFLLFYVYALVLLVALAFSAVSLSLHAASGSLRARLRQRTTQKRLPGESKERPCTKDVPGASNVCVSPRMNRVTLLRSCG